MSQLLGYHEEITHQSIEAGATLIIGHHPHAIQKIEVCKTSLITYSLDNFIFTFGSQKGSKSILLELILDRYGVKNLRVWPIKILNTRPKIAREKIVKK